MCQFLIGKVQRTLDNMIVTVVASGITCQFLIGKVQLNDSSFPSIHDIRCQFLIGKVQRFLQTQIILQLKNRTCQFLIGKVQLNNNV